MRKSKIENRKLLKVMVFIVAVAGIQVTGVVDGKVLPKTAELVPAETILLLDIDDFSQLRGQIEKTSIYKLWKDPAMSGFVEKFKGKWQAELGAEQDDLLKTIFGLEVWPTGRVALALVLNEQTKEMDEPPVLLISQWGEDVAKIREAMEKAMEKEVGEGLGVSMEDYRGITIVTTTKEQAAKEVADWENFDPDKGPVGMKTVQPGPVKSSYCFIEDCFIFSMDIDVLKFVIAHIQGVRGSSLSDDVDYTAAMGAVGPYHDIDFYVNIKQLVSVAVAEDNTGEAQGTLSNLGFDNVAGIGCAAGVSREADSSWGGKFFVKVNGAKRGICKMLEFESGPVKAPRFMPASAYAVMFVNLDIKKAYDELYNIIYKMSPTSAAAMHTPLLPASPDGQPGVELKSDIIDYLGPEIVMAQSMKKPFETRNIPTETLFAVGVRDRSGLENSLSLLHNRFIGFNDPDAKRELLGHTLYIVKLPNLPFFGREVTPMQAGEELQQPQGPSMAFTVTDSHLIVGEESSVEQAIRTLSIADAPSISAAEWFRAARAAISSMAGVAAFEDSAASAELLWWMLKESSKDSGGLRMGPAGYMLGAAEVREWADFGLLPEFDSVRKYFGPSVFYGVSRADGFFFESKWLNQRGEQ